jgi:hypothetical protein
MASLEMARRILLTLTNEDISSMMPRKWGSIVASDIRSKLFFNLECPAELCRRFLFSPLHGLELLAIQNIVSL